MLQTAVSRTSPEQASPPNCSEMATGRSRVRLPPLHGRSHLPQSDQSASSQFTGVLVVELVCDVVVAVVVLVVSDVVLVKVVFLRMQLHQERLIAKILKANRKLSKYTVQPRHVAVVVVVVFST